MGLRDPEGVELGPVSLAANRLANSDPMKAASKSQGPNRWRMEEQRGRATATGADPRLAWCSGSVPVTALSTKAEVAATKVTLQTVRRRLTCKFVRMNKNAVPGVCLWRLVSRGC